MTRAFLCLTLLFSIIFVNVAQAQDPFLEKAEKWFNNLKTAQASFVQTGADGQDRTGTFYLSRPGRLRFEYDAPIDDFIVADGVMIHFYDGELRDVSNALIGQTPADFILRGHLSFTDMAGDLIVTETRHSGNVFRMTLLQRGDPDAGQIIMDFSKEPINLMGWGIMDSMGGYTKIALNNLEKDVQISPTLFRYIDPEIKSGKRTPFNN